MFFINTVDFFIIFRIYMILRTQIFCDGIIYVDKNLDWYKQSEL